ncbi:ATP-binding protein [Aeromonas dhakensis]|uniref:hypothetical protein n=1 Tax=Aeromonas dhakensis TaxID=196024 RepID=UPI00191E4ABF|nr:hypothetical protein [Aeromonas dhakensis]MBL0460809.1 hypothetical protein [Aeromonas dhakensis]
MSTIIAPVKLCVYYDDHVIANTIEFLRELAARGEQGPITLDLRRTEKVTGAAALMLFAHVNTLQLKHGSRSRVKCLFPDSKENENGHNDIVKTRLSRALSSGSVAELEQLVLEGTPFQSSNDPSVHASRTVKYLTDKLGLRKTDQLVLTLTAAISEAMLNVVHHAYDFAPSIFTGDLQSRWWQYANFDRKNNRFVFLIYDLGLGIIKSYKSSTNRHQDDAFLLEEALSFGCSRFSKTQPWRGNGSEDIKHPVNLGESLFIYCENLRYIYRGDPTSAKIDRTLCKLDGNLIEWTLKIADVQEEAS